MSFLKRWQNLLFAIFLFLLSMVFRVTVLAQPRPLWVDEFCTITQARLVNQHKIFDADYYFEHENITTHFFTAGLLQLFPHSQGAVPLAFILLASFVSPILFLTFRHRYGTTPVFLAALLLALNYFEITWSTQLRGYMLQQLLAILFFALYLSSFDAKFRSKKQLFLLFILGVLGVLTHKMFFFVALSAGLHFLFFWHQQIIKIVKKYWYIAIFLIIIATILFKVTQISTALTTALQYQFLSLYNNFWYYKAFLWGSNSLLVFFAILGGLLLSIQLAKKHENTLIFSLIFFQLLFITFFFGHHMTKYVLPILPFLYLLMGVGIWEVMQEVTNRMQHTVVVVKRLPQRSMTAFASLAVVLFLLLMGQPYVRKPQNYYSVNKDMREIAVVDYDQVYAPIQAALAQYGEQQVAVIDTWGCRIQYYLGFDHDNLYLFGWLNDGFMKTTDYLVNQEGEKYFAQSGKVPVKFIATLPDLEMAMKKYQYGFIWIDDSSLPQDVQRYVKENFHLELTLDSYGPELLENPYSKWPGVLYSWGFAAPNPLYQGKNAN